MKLSIIANPRAGGGRVYNRLQRLVGRWPHPGWSVDVQTTSGPGHASVLARGLLGRPPDLLAVCGGDGTYNEVVNGLHDPPFPVAIIPAGTGNVLARDIGIPTGVARAVQVALEMNVRRVDLCLLEGATSRAFILMAGAGYDAYVVANTPTTLKNRFGLGAFYYTTLRCLLTYRFPAFVVSTEGDSVTCATCVVANSRGYGGGLVLTPDADMSDGILDLVALGGGSRLKFARFALSAWLGRPGHYPWVRYLRAQEVTIDGSSDVPVQVDGELAGMLPVKVRLLPGAFPMVVAKPAGPSPSPA